MSLKRADRQVQMELLAPKEIDALVAEKSIVYVPLGAIEYHGPHLPIGLDSLTSHGLCLATAKNIGGVVMPPLYYGMTGSIGHHPWTICV
ncbi:MAG: creatininase family protein, partial [Saprospiraceae bacterium]|nr:creatininase family protein [Saprospiraceae bacterium]